MKLVDATESRQRAFVLSTAATALTLVGSFLNFLNYNAYPVTSAEALLVLGGMLAVSVLVGLLGAGLGVFGQMVIPTVLVVVAVQVNFQAAILPLYAVVPALLARFSRQALIIWFGVVTVSQLWTAMIGAEGPPLVVSKGVEVGSTAVAKPDIAVVHLILDEHIGLEGIPDSAPGGPELREQLRKFYLEHGFRIMAGAYSESLHTVNAIPRALGLRSDVPWKKRGSGGTTLEENPYFDTLQSMGFQIVVAQTDWVDYCGHPAVTTCMTRVAGNLIDMGDQLPTSDKAAILAYRFAALSTFASVVFSFYDVTAVSGQRFGIPLPVVQLERRTTTSALNAMASFDWAIEQARSLEPGKAMFAHILLPHYPYSYDADCRVRRLADWLSRVSVAPWKTPLRRILRSGDLRNAESRPAAGGRGFIQGGGQDGLRHPRRSWIAHHERRTNDRERRPVLRTGPGGRTRRTVRGFGARDRARLRHRPLSAAPAARRSGEFRVQPREPRPACRIRSLDRDRKSRMGPRDGASSAWVGMVEQAAREGWTRIGAVGGI